MIQFIIIGLIYGFLSGMIFTAFFILSLLHKRFYGSWIIDKQNLPFSKKLKQNLDLNKNFIVGRDGG